jgi:hypothetical protein
MLLVFALLWEPRINAIFFEVVYWITDQLGIPLAAIAYGMQLFRFWT